MCEQGERVLSGQIRVNQQRIQAVYPSHHPGNSDFALNVVLCMRTQHCQQQD
jgi:hypothetical protein